MTSQSLPIRFPFYAASTKPLSFSFLFCPFLRGVSQSSSCVHKPLRWIQSSEPSRLHVKIEERKRDGDGMIRVKVFASPFQVNVKQLQWHKRFVTNNGMYAKRNIIFVFLSLFSEKFNFTDGELLTQQKQVLNVEKEKKEIVYEAYMKRTLSLLFSIRYRTWNTKQPP